MKFQRFPLRALSTLARLTLTASLPALLVYHGQASARRSLRHGHGGQCQMVVNCSRNNDTMKCLTCNALGEAGQDASIIEVNRTVIARTESGIYPRNICSVIYQRTYRSAQFSWTLKHPEYTCTTPGQWKHAQEAAKKAAKAGSNHQLNFYATYVHPRWARNCWPKRQVGGHIFCTYGGPKRSIRKGASTAPVFPESEPTAKTENEASNGRNSSSPQKARGVRAPVRKRRPRGWPFGAGPYDDQFWRRGPQVYGPWDGPWDDYGEAGQ